MVEVGQRPLLQDILEVAVEGRRQAVVEVGQRTLLQDILEVAVEGRRQAVVEVGHRPLVQDILEVAVNGRRQAGVDVDGQPSLLSLLLLKHLGLFAGFLEQAVDRRMVQVPVDEQLSAGLRAAPLAAAVDRGRFAVAVDVDLVVFRGAAARADAFAPRGTDATHYTNATFARQK